MLFGRGACAESEPLLMMRPPRGTCVFINATAARVQRNAPVRFVSTTARQSSRLSSSISTGGAPRPALLKRAFYLVGSGAELEGCVVGGKGGGAPFGVLAEAG